MTDGFRGKRTIPQHWPVMLLGFVVACIFAAALVVFEVRETEYALVLRFGQPTGKVFEPGLHLKWPDPIETVWRHDKRLQCFDMQTGQVEQVQTLDNFQIIVSTFVLWQVGDPIRFLSSVSTTDKAKEHLNAVVRSSRGVVIGRHRLDELINVDAERVRIPDIEREILEQVQTTASDQYGIHVQHLGFKHLGFPEDVTMKVFARMRAERGRKSEAYRAQGRRDAAKIRAEADLKVSEKIAEAEAEAKRIRAEGDKAAAEHYSVFQQDPELAAFLRKLEALRLTLSQKTTLILDTNTPPYDLFQPGATDLKHDVDGTARRAPGQGGAK